MVANDGALKLITANYFMRGFSRFVSTDGWNDTENNQKNTADILSIPIAAIARTAPVARSVSVVCSPRTHRSPCTHCSANHYDNCETATVEAIEYVEAIAIIDSVRRNVLTVSLFQAFALVERNGDGARDVSYHKRGINQETLQTKMELYFWHIFVN